MSWFVARCSFGEGGDRYEHEPFEMINEVPLVVRPWHLSGLPNNCHNISQADQKEEKIRR